MKEWILAALGITGAFITSLFGGWAGGLNILMVCMGLDYISGFLVAAVFKKSKKTETGALQSTAGLKGLVKKGMILVFVLVGYQLDTFIGTDFIRSGVIIAFISNEVISLVENAGLMGVPIPTVIAKAIDILQKRSGEINNKMESEKHVNK